MVPMVIFYINFIPISNKRTDEYGRISGCDFSYAAKEALPESFPTGSRITGTEWEKIGINETILCSKITVYV